MGLIEDFRKEIDHYDGEYVDVNLVNLDPDGKHVNDGEWFKFRIQVQNKGHLDMKNVSVLLAGSRFAQVSDIPGNTRHHVNIKIGDIDAHSSKRTKWMHGYATKQTENQKKNVVTARIAQWDASLQHLLKDHSKWGPKEGKINIVILP